MATGKELVRMVTCSLWRENVKSREDFCSAQIFDSVGKPISLKQAKIGTFCHARILFRHCPEEELKLLGCLLQIVASTNGEHMSLSINEYYGFQEIVIS